MKNSNISLLKAHLKTFFSGLVELLFFNEILATFFNPAKNLDWAKVQKRNRTAWFGLWIFVMILEFLDAALFTQPHFESVLPFSEKQHWLVGFLTTVSLWAWGFSLLLAIVDQWVIQKAMENLVKQYFVTAFLFFLFVCVIKATIIYTSIAGAKVVAYNTTEKPNLVGNDVFLRKNKDVQNQIRELNAPIAEIESQIKAVRSQINKLEADVREIEKSPANHKGWHNAQPLLPKAEERVANLNVQISQLNEQIRELSNGKIEAMKNAKDMSTQILKQNEKETDRLNKQNDNLITTFENKAGKKGNELSLIAIGLAILSLLGGGYYYYTKAWLLFYDTEKKHSAWANIWEKAKAPIESVGNKIKPLLNHRAKGNGEPVCPAWEKRSDTDPIPPYMVDFLVAYSNWYESQNLEKPSLGLLANKSGLAKNSVKNKLIQRGLIVKED
jgi:TolA-binding protein